MPLTALYPRSPHRRSNQARLSRSAGKTVARTIARVGTENHGGANVAIAAFIGTITKMEHRSRERTDSDMARTCEGALNATGDREVFPPPPARIRRLVRTARVKRARGESDRIGSRKQAPYRTCLSPVASKQRLRRGLSRVVIVGDVVRLDDMNEKKESSSGGSSPFGCLGCVVTILALWALVFGVTWGGIKYVVKCSATNGVEFVRGAP